MTIIRDIVELKQWQTDWDQAMFDTIVQQTLAAHPTNPPDLSPRAYKLIGSHDVGTCECGDATFTIRDEKTGRTAPACRMCINAVRRQSLGHLQYTAEICWVCRITTDSLGLIDGAIHRTKPYEDELQQNGTVRAGIGPLIRAGRIDLTNDVLTILP